MQIFIGAESHLFGVAGCSMVIAPYQNSRRADRRRDRGHRPHPDQLRPDHPDGGLHRQGDRAPHRIGQMMNDTGNEQETAASAERAAAANNNVEQGCRPAVAGGAGWRRSKPSSPSRRTACCGRWPRPRTPAAGPSASARTPSKYAITGFAKDLLSAADNLRRALDSLPEAEVRDERTRNLLAGVAATERELLSVFERHGIRRIDPHGRALRPQFPSGDLRGRARATSRPARSSRCCSPAMCCTTGCCGRRWSASRSSRRSRPSREHAGLTGTSRCSAAKRSLI